MKTLPVSDELHAAIRQYAAGRKKPIRAATAEAFRLLLGKRFPRKAEERKRLELEEDKT